jgi:hypothetical protein
MKPMQDSYADLVNGRYCQEAGGIGSMTWSVRSALLALLLTVSFSSGFAESPRLTAHPGSVTPNESFSVRVAGAPSDALVAWSNTPNVRRTATDPVALKATYKALSPGAAIITATITSSLQSWVTNTAVEVAKHPITKSKFSSDGDPEPVPEAKKPTLNAKELKAQKLMEKYKPLLDGHGLLDRFGRKDKAVEKLEPSMSDAELARIKNLGQAFLNEMSDTKNGPKIAVKDMQSFESKWKIINGQQSEHPLEAGQKAWDADFLAVERALTYGRNKFSADVVLGSLKRFFKDNPHAVGVLYAKLNVGSWDKWTLGGLGWAGDVDWAAASSESTLHKDFVDNYYEPDLKAATGMDMVNSDLVGTPHGQGRPIVFIDRWGQKWSEGDLLKRSTWEFIDVKVDSAGKLILDNQGKPIVKLQKRPGKQLFWERSIREGKPIDWPDMKWNLEPMISMEMQRHATIDVEKGPYRRARQLIKMLKYGERTYFTGKKTMSSSRWDPYTQNDPNLAKAATAIKQHKDDPAKVAQVLDKLLGAGLTHENVDARVSDLINRTKVAMDNNATRALAFRMDKISAIADDVKRQEAADLMWNDMSKELKAFEDSGVTKPPVMVDACKLAKDLQSNTITADEFADKAKQLHALLDSAVGLGPTKIERIVNAYAYLERYLQNTLKLTQEAAKDYTRAAAKKVPGGTKAYDLAASLYKAAVEVDATISNSLDGHKLLMDVAGRADDLLAIHDAYRNAKNTREACWAASKEIGKWAVFEKYPGAQIPFALYTSCSTGDITPIGMAVGFRIFPGAGQAYMLYQLGDRSLQATRETQFYNALNHMMYCVEFDTSHRITKFYLRHPVKRSIIQHEELVSPAGNRDRIIQIFEDPGNPFCTSGNFSYWRALTPDIKNPFGEVGGSYEAKLARLRTFFPESQEVNYNTLMLEHYRGKMAKGLQKDPTSANSNLTAEQKKQQKQKLTAKQEQTLDVMELELRKAVWIAMADGLESAAKSVDSPEFKAKIKEIEQDLSLGEQTMGWGANLQGWIDQEVYKNSSFVSGENPYGVGTIYEKYIGAYSKIVSTREQILHNIWWIDFGIDNLDARKAPMKELLRGGDKAAPSLTGELAKDEEIAQLALKRHQARAAKIRTDLKNALGRDIDNVNDRPHLKALGQWAFETEHLRDDCPEYALANATPAIRSAMVARAKAYNDYLKTIKDAKPVPVHLTVKQQIDGQLTDKIIKLATVKLTPTDSSKPSPSLPEEAEDGKHVVQLSPGKYSLVVSAKGFTSVAGQAEHSEALEIKVPEQGQEDTPVTKTVALCPIKGQVIVHVVEKESKELVTGVNVKLLPAKAPYIDSQLADDGSFTFEDINPGTNYSVQADVPFYVCPVIRSGIVVDNIDPEKSSSPVTIELQPMLSKVRVTVQGEATGSPLEGATVTLGESDVETDSAGIAEFDTVRAGGDTLFSAVAVKPGFAPAGKDLKINPTQNGQVFPLALSLKHGGQVLVKVLNKDTGAAVEQPEIHVSGPGYKKQILGSAEGEALFEHVAMDTYYVDTWKEGYLKLENPVEITLSESTPERTVEVKLSEGVKLHVINVEQGKNLNIGGYVTVDGGERSMTSRDFRLTKGAHSIVCTARGYSKKSLTYQVDPAKGDSQTIEVELYPAMTITVEVRDHRGALMGDAKVSLLKDGVAVGSATGKAPLFSELGAGSYTAKVEAPGFAPGTSASVQLEGGYDDRPDSQSISIALTPYKANLAVSVAGLDEGDSADIALSGPISVGASGDKATFRGLTRGSYAIAATAEGYNPATTAIEIIPASEGDNLTAALSLTKTAETLAAEQAAAEKKKKDEAAKKKADTIASLIKDGKIDEAIALLGDLSDEEKGAVIDLLSPEDQTKLTAPQAGAEDEDEAMSEDELDQVIEDEIDALEAKEKKEDDKDADEELSEDDIEAIIADGLDDLLKTKDPAGGEKPPIVVASVPDEDDEESEGDEARGEDEPGDVVDKESEYSGETEEEKSSTTGKGDSASGVAEGKPEPGDKPGLVDMPKDEVTKGEADRPSKKGTSDLSDITNLDDADEEDLKDSIAGDVRGMAEDEKKQTDEELSGFWIIKGLVNTAPFVHEWQAHVKRENERDEDVAIYLFRVYPLPARLVLKIDPDNGVVRGSVRTPFVAAIGAVGIQGIVRAHIDGELKGHYNAFTETMSGTVVDQGFIKGRFFMAGQEIYRAAEESDKLNSTWSAEGDPRSNLSGVYNFGKRGNMIAPIPMKFYTSASIESTPGFGRRDRDLENYVKKDSENMLDKILGTSCFAGWQGGDRNRFEAVLEDGQLTVYGQTYNDGLRRFNDRVQIGTASQVSDYELGLGGIDNLSNSGFLVYETTSGQLHYMLLGLESTSHFGSRKQAARTTVRMQGLITRDYEMGSMDLQTYSRAGAVSWINELGREDSGHISKTKGWCND